MNFVEDRTEVPFYEIRMQSISDYRSIFSFGPQRGAGMCGVAAGRSNGCEL